MVGRLLTQYVIILPMKDLRCGKSRLITVLSDEARQKLIENLFSRVVFAAKKSIVDEIWVVGAGQKLEQICSVTEVKWIKAGGKDLNQDLSNAIVTAQRRSLTPIYLPGDLPFVEPWDINQVIKRSCGGRKFVLVPSSYRDGTNCMLIPTWLHFRTLLGEGSFGKHKRMLRELNVDFVNMCPAGITLDLDTADDLTHCNVIEKGFICRLGMPINRDGS